MRNEYEPNTAVTFLLLGLGVGTVLALVCSPQVRQRAKLEEINSWSTRHAEPRADAEGEGGNKRVA